MTMRSYPTESKLTQGSVLPFSRIPTNRCSRKDGNRIIRQTHNNYCANKTHRWMVQLPGHGTQRNRTGQSQSTGCSDKGEGPNYRGVVAHTNLTKESANIGRDFQLPHGLNPKTRADNSVWKCLGLQPGMTTERKALFLRCSNLTPPLLCPS